MGRYGVTANSIAPRATTRMIGAIPDSAAEIRARSGIANLGDEGERQELDPNGIAPFVCYLASDYSANINGQIFLVYANTISLMSQPRPQNAIFTPSGTWNMTELVAQARDVLTRGITNPTPAQ